MELDVWLVRHGETEWSAARRFAGWSDLALTAAGEAQAAALVGLLPTGQGVRAWTSDLRRCVDTARLAGLAATPDRRLRELDFGDVDGAAWDELPSEVQDQLLAFDGFAAPNGESVEQLRTRVHEFLRSLAPGRHVVVTHGGVVRQLLRDAGADGAVVTGEVVRVQFAAAGAAMMTPCLVDPSSC
ncbi:histidine phosphatase family protein [Aquihabitans daechungensis]|uniref:histidine phosphatase family protein n=1 Tax=Aquihabitans daechungensis TaxID=1052257 RepID=UPI003BA17274